MQLNNNRNGHIILIDKIDILQNRIVYTEYEHKNENLTFVKKQSSHVFNDINLKDYLNQSINYTELCYNQLKTEKELTDFIVSEDTQNWLFPDRPYRIAVVSSFILKELQPLDNTGTLSDIGTLIENEKIKNFGFYIDNSEDKISIIYVNTIEPDDMTIVTPYLNNTMFVETKNN